MSNAKFDISVGKNVQAMRKARGMSQTDLAEHLLRLTGTNYHQQTILRIEKGERPLKLSEAMAVAKAFGVPPTVLWRVSEVDALVGSWMQRTEDISHRKQVAEVELQQISAEFERAVLLSSALLHLQEFLSGGPVDPVHEALGVIAEHVDGTTEATPIRDRIRLDNLLRELGVSDDEIEKAATRTGDQSAAALVRTICEKHQFRLEGDER